MSVVVPRGTHTYWKTVFSVSSLTVLVQVDGGARIIHPSRSAVVRNRFPVKPGDHKIVLVLFGERRARRLRGIRSLPNDRCRWPGGMGVSFLFAVTNEV